MKLSRIFLLSIVYLFVVTSLSFAVEVDQELLRVGIAHKTDISTIRLQSFSGNWTLKLFPKPASGSKEIPPPEKEIVIEGEDISLMVVPKGIVCKTSTGKDVDTGYEKIVISGGEIVNLEVPNQAPILFLGELEISLNEQFLKIVNIIKFHQFLVSSVSKFATCTEPEAIKAFIIMARTRLMYLKANKPHPKENFDVCDEEHCLPFNGASFNRELIDILVGMVKNKHLLYKNKLFFPRYQECCGGKISSGKEIFDENEPYHVDKIDRLEDEGSENCFHSPGFHWSIELSKKSILEFLSVTYAGGADRLLSGWEPVKVDRNGRISQVLLRGRRPKKISGVKFLQDTQAYFGPNAIKSMKFNMDILRRSVIFRGMGQGEGVGMCIYGADGMAKKAIKFKKILEFYYPGTSLKN